MPNGFLPTICRLIWPVDPIPTRRRGQARAEGSPSRREARLRSARKESSSFGLGRGFAPPPGWRVGSTPWRIRLARPDPRFASTRRGRRKKWRRNVEKAAKRLCRFRRGAERAKGRGGGGRGESRKNGGKKTEREGKKTEGRMGTRRKKRKTKSGALRRRGTKKKEAIRLLFFLRFASAPRGA